MRGLGANRTLVLVNGRRLAPAGSSGQLGPPDLNTLPQSMIERFEILKDGSSSIYGSDAVAGAVNVITRKNYEGLSISGDANYTFEGGGNSYRLDGIWGNVFDRGSIMVSGEYYRRESLVASDRDYFACNQDLVRENGTGRVWTSSTRPPDSRFARTPSRVSRPLAGGNFVPDPTAVLNGGPYGLDIPGYRRVGITYSRMARVFGAPTFCGVDFHVCTATEQFAAMTPAQRAQTEAAWRTSQDDLEQNDPRFASTDMVAPVERRSAYVQGAYDVGSGIELYTENMFTRRKSTSMPSCSCSRSLRRVTSRIRSRRCAPSPMNPFDQSQEIDFYRTVWGTRGELGPKVPLVSRWSYDLYARALAVGRFVHEDVHLRRPRGGDDVVARSVRRVLPRHLRTGRLSDGQLVHGRRARRPVDAGTARLLVRRGRGHDDL